MFRFHNGYEQLRSVVVGNVYNERFFSPVKDAKLRDGLTRILSETIEDIDNIKTILANLGIVVMQPTVDDNLTIMDYAHNGDINKSTAQSNSLIPRPPLQVRDSFFVLGDRMYQTRKDGDIIQQFIEKSLGKVSGLDFDVEFDAPVMTILNDRIFVDVEGDKKLDTIISNKFPDKTVIPVHVGGHTDAVFSIIKPGVLITCEDPSLYNDTFPGWSVLSLPDQSWKAVQQFRNIKIKNGGRWWTPELQENQHMVDFVDTWLNEWYGYAKETVFDVNCLVINEGLVLVNNYNKDMDAFFKKHNVEYIIAPLRHRFFWDGGIHCITNDLYRG